MNTAALSKNWKTTTLGVLGLLSLLIGAAKAVIDSDPTTNIDFGTFVPALMALISAIFSKDADKTGVPTP